ncbi:MAG: hypothetical protein ACRCV9_05835 [Burkholderiaceae bacterium]
MKYLAAIFLGVSLSTAVHAAELFPAQTGAVTGADNKAFSVSPNVTLIIIGTLGAGESVTLQRRRGNVWVNEDVITSADEQDGVIGQAGQYRIVKTATAQAVTVDLIAHSDGRVYFDR